jgi:hypothetical protein
MGQFHSARTEAGRPAFQADTSLDNAAQQLAELLCAGRAAAPTKAAMANLLTEHHPELKGVEVYSAMDDFLTWNSNRGLEKVVSTSNKERMGLGVCQGDLPMRTRGSLMLLFLAGNAPPPPESGGGPMPSPNPPVY